MCHQSIAGPSLIAFVISACSAEFHHSSDVDESTVAQLVDGTQRERQCAGSHACDDEAYRQQARTNEAKCVRVGVDHAHHRVCSLSSRSVSSSNARARSYYDNRSNCVRMSPTNLLRCPSRVARVCRSRVSVKFCRRDFVEPLMSTISDGRGDTRASSTSRRQHYMYSTHVSIRFDRVDYRSSSRRRSVAHLSGSIVQRQQA